MATGGCTQSPLSELSSNIRITLAKVACFLDFSIEREQGKEAVRLGCLSVLGELLLITTPPVSDHPFDAIIHVYGSANL